MSSDLNQYLKNHIGSKIYLNADDQSPYVLDAVEQDYIRLSQKREFQKQTSEVIIPLTAIVSVQEVDGLLGVIVYLIK